MGSLTIKNLPDDVLERFRERARRHHRSMQQELRFLIEEATAPERISVEELSRRVEAIGLKTPAESVEMLRHDRDSDHGRAGR